MKRTSFANIVLATVLLVLLPTRPAHAYIDPGTGSYVFQVGIAVVFGAVYGVKLSWNRLVGKVRSRITKQSPTDPND